ncbi:hypothetical protein [Paradevosia shaoguanensis]|jgi:hypothetical protein|uniref:hypothetical protein n=1 Tax=Paradevosia shaoguanensis TaxID=1335043 RepID=UPI000455C849|nr:hypothetical protein [Paradevosia shaoguanensis]KFL27417.1 hypothetical protein JP74_07475 [Devosia sp. 17-2-E-8]MBI4046141.1 hypothetical protein [Devosia nanyangense]CDP50827.1 hypothetical protein [Devosia sp. DBB001]
MTPRRLDAFERTALGKLAQVESLELGTQTVIGFGRPALERLCSLGLAQRVADAPTAYAITSDGYRCIYGMSQAEFEAHPANAKPPPLRQWQWPPAA